MGILQFEVVDILPFRVEVLLQLITLALVLVILLLKLHAICLESAIEDSSLSFELFGNRIELFGVLTTGQFGTWRSKALGGIKTICNLNINKKKNEVKNKAVGFEKKQRNNNSKQIETLGRFNANVIIEVNLIEYFPAIDLFQIYFMAIGKSCTIKESAHGAVVVRYDGIANTKKKQEKSSK